MVLSSAALTPAVAQQPQYTISTIGGGPPPPPSTPARALDLPIGTVSNLIVDAAGNVYFNAYNAVYKLDQDGIVTRVAGTSLTGFSGDGGQR